MLTNEPRLTSSVQRVEQLHWESSVKRKSFCLQSSGENILSPLEWVGLLQILLQDHLNAWKTHPHMLPGLNTPDKPQP